MPRTNKGTSAAAANRPAVGGRRVELKDDVKDTFPSKTYDVIEHCDRHDPSVASWDDDGTAFIVKDVSSLEQLYLPKKFDHSNFQSFVRQLNLYGFRNVSKEKEGSTTGDSGAGTGHIVFRNDNFKRGRRDLLANIRRSKKGDRSQRKTRQEEELHAVCEALNQRFDRVDLEVKSLHAKVDLLSARLDKVLNLLLSDPPRGAGDDSGSNQDSDGRRGGLGGKRRRLGGGEGGGEGGRGDDDGAHSVSASEASRDVTGVPAARLAAGGDGSSKVSANSFGRNVSPACSENLPVSPFPLPPGPSRASSAEKSRNSSGGFTGTEIGVVVDNNEAVKFDSDLLAACETILENSMDEDDERRRSDDRDFSQSSNPPQDRADKPGQEDISDLDALPLNLDGFGDGDEGGSSSLSGDDMLMSYDGPEPPGVSASLQVATVYDHENAGRASDISFRRGRAGNFLSHRTIMAGITLMSVIAAVAVGTIFSVGRSSQDGAPVGPPESTMGAGPLAEDTDAAPPCTDCTTSMAPVNTKGEETAADEDAVVMTAADEDAGVVESVPGDWDEPPLRVSPTPSPSLVPSSRRRALGDWNNISPTSELPTLRTIRF